VIVCETGSEHRNVTKVYPSMSYTQDEVEVLIEVYMDVSPRRNQGLWRYRLIDIDRCLPLVPPVLREALVLVGLAGLSFNQAAHYLSIDSTTVIRRYFNGIVWLTAKMNGGRVNFK
jgi:DNA-directed RNA polymerase specialized sigma24 family protein